MSSPLDLFDLIHRDPYCELVHDLLDSIARIQWRTQGQLNAVIDTVTDCKAAIDDEANFFVGHQQDGQFGLRRVGEVYFRCMVRRLCIALAGGMPGPIEDDLAQIRKPNRHSETGCLNCGKPARMYCDERCRLEFAADLMNALEKRRHQ